MEVLTTSGLSKQYKGHFAVKDVNMHIEKDDIYGFVGENGAGKTTVIRMITGLAAPTSGSFTLFGVQDRSGEIYEKKRKVGAIVEAASINRSMTAMDNLKLQCMITGAVKTDAELEGLLDLVGLDHEAIRKKTAGKVSLGMRQRLGLAMVMVSDAEFIVLDEPMNGLDPQGFVDVREAILRLHKTGVTFLISSHLLSELEKVCTKVGVISHGHLLQEITMDELHRKSRKKIVITADTEAGIRDALKDALGLQEIVTEGDHISIYDEADLNDLMRVLVEKHLIIRSISVSEDTIEDYYIKVIGKGAVS